MAVRGTDPPVCASHSASRRGGGAARGNRNPPEAGFYSRVLDEDELADLVVLGADSTLTDEIAVARVAVRRVLEALGREGGPEPGVVDPHFVGLLLDGTRTVARLLRERQAISGKAADRLAEAIGSALDQLNTIWGTDL